MLSDSGRKVRIVQGVVNFAKGTTEIRVSQIVSFEEGGVRGNWRQWLALLGWAVGKPVGRTR
ncbi:hypothetical protein IMZ48_17265 [Candidatus Bathyarchaeota archaeon]|nr:hypothetical protein [Candidatus Bathyarchaeota archaeon]